MFFSVYLPVEILALITGAAVFCFLLFFIFCYNHFSVRKINKHGNRMISKENDGIFHALFPDTKKVAKRLSVDLDKYTYYCNIVCIPVQTETLLAEKISGFAIIGFLFILSIFFSQPILLPFSVLCGMPFISYRYAQAKNLADKKKRQIAKDLPRFIDLLQTALYIGVPVESAVLQTAQKLDNTLLGQEFIQAFTSSQLGVKSWQKTLECVSKKYEIDALSDFTLDLILSYEKGVNVCDSVRRKGKEIKSMNLMQMKANASKLTSTILVPVLVFKIIPLLALLCYPVIIQIQRGF